MAFTSQQLTTLLNEMNNDPESLGYAAYIPGGGINPDVNSLTVVLNSLRDGVTPSVPNGIVGPSGNITGATNATPVVVASTTHGRTTGDSVVISGVGGNTAANGTWVITVTDSNHFSLTGSIGSGAYTSGGTWSWCITTLANSSKVINYSVSSDTLLGQIAPADVAASLTAVQLAIIQGFLTDGQINLVDSSGNETNAATWVKMLATGGTASAKAIKALEGRFGSRSEQILNKIGQTAGQIVTAIDLQAAFAGHY